MAKVLETWEKTCPGCEAKATFRRYECKCVDWTTSQGRNDPIHKPDCPQGGFFTSQTVRCGASGLHECHKAVEGVS